MNKDKVMLVWKGNKIPCEDCKVIYVSCGSVKKRPGNPNWGGARQESKLIEKYADEWCKENGYPLIKRKYVYKGKWKLVDIKR